jgi:tetratricopeptide (TPR) repeat protein
VEVAAGVAIFGLIAMFGLVSGRQALAVGQQRDVAASERDRAEEVIQVLVDMFEASAPVDGDRADTLRLADFLIRSEEEVLTRLEDQPSLRVRMQQVLGNVYAVRGQQAKAVEILTNAADGQLALTGEDSTYAAIMVDLGTVDSKQHGAGAEPRLRKALELQRTLFVEPHPYIASALQSLASVLDDATERRALLAESLEMGLVLMARVDPVAEDDVWRAALGFNQLAVDYYRTGEVTEASENFERSVELLEQIRPPDHNDVLAVKTNLAAIYNRREEYARAAALQRELLQVHESRGRGPTLHRAIALGNLATTHFYQRDFDRAGILLDSALVMHETVLGPGHGRTANLLRTLAFVHAQTGDYQRAYDLLTQALTIRLAFDGGVSVASATLEAQRAWYWLPLGEPNRGLSEAQRALEDLIARLPDGRGAQFAIAREVLGEALLETNDAEGAHAEFERVVRIREELFGEGHSSVDIARAKLAMSLASLGRSDEARALLADAIDTVRRSAVPYQLKQIEAVWARLTRS